MRSLLAATALLMAACSVGPFRLFASLRPTPKPAMVLTHCDEVQDVLCLLTFGLEPPDQMLIVLLASPGLPRGLEAVVTHKESTVSYPCEAVDESATVIYCIGPQIPLGSSLRIQVYATEGRTYLASGEFVLLALALPTVGVGGAALPNPDALMTARPTRTGMPGPTFPPPSRRVTPSTARTALPGLTFPTPSAMPRTPRPNPDY